MRVSVVPLHALPNHRQGCGSSGRQSGGANIPKPSSASLSAQTRIPLRDFNRPVAARVYGRPRLCKYYTANPRRKTTCRADSSKNGVC